MMKEYKIIFWDFDGVIKDSVEVKSVAFEQLFLPYGKELATKVRHHHEAHGGVSRFEKMPLYLRWAGQSDSEENIHVFCNHFSKLVMQAVIDSAWVPGVQEYLKKYYEQQYFVLITATPQEEIEEILNAIQLTYCFREIYGAPKTKADSIQEVLRHLQVLPAQALVVGDSNTDFNAAVANNVNFMLRRTSLNQDLQKKCSDLSFDSFNYE